MNSLLKYLGTIVVLIGGGVLIYAGLNQSYSDNTFLGLGLALVILGFILHILLNKFVVKD